MVSNMSAATEFAPISSLRLVPPEQPDCELSLDELGSRIVGLAGRLAAATCRWLLLVADFDARDGCARWGLANTAAWLMHTCALSRRTAFEHVRVARALAAHRQLAQDMETGRLSYSQVRAITRAVRPGDDETVADLSQAAQHCSIGQLETVVRGMRTCERNDEGIDADDGDYVRSGWTSTSRWQLNARLAPDQGKLVDAAIAAVARTEKITHAEALVRMAEVALITVNDSEHPPRPLRGDERAAIVVHVNASDIPREECSAEHSAHSEDAAPAGRLQDGPGLPWPVIEKLLCQGRIRTAVHDGEGNIQYLGRSHRTVPLRLFRALLHRDRGHCRHPGCTSRAGLHAHHIKHWIDGGRTDMPNLILLCERHHHLHHEGAFRIHRLGKGRFRFIDAVGTDLSASPDREALAKTSDHVEVDFAATPDDAATPRWDGYRMDHDFAISCLADSLARRRNVERPATAKPESTHPRVEPPIARGEAWFDEAWASSARQRE